MTTMFLCWKMCLPPPPPARGAAVLSLPTCPCGAAATAVTPIAPAKGRAVPALPHTALSNHLLCLGLICPVCLHRRHGVCSCSVPGDVPLQQRQNTPRLPQLDTAQSCCPVDTSPPGAGAGQCHHGPCVSLRPLRRDRSSSPAGLSLQQKAGGTQQGWGCLDIVNNTIPSPLVLLKCKAKEVAVGCEWPGS